MVSHKGRVGIHYGEECQMEWMSYYNNCGCPLHPGICVHPRSDKDHLDCTISYNCCPMTRETRHVSVTNQLLDNKILAMDEKGMKSIDIAKELGIEREKVWARMKAIRRSKKSNQTKVI